MFSSESAQAVFAFDLIFGQAADSGERTTAVGDGDGDHDFVGAGRVVDAHFHAVEVAAHEGRVLMAEWNVEGHAESAALFG